MSQLAVGASLTGESYRLAMEEFVAALCAITMSPAWRSSCRPPVVPTRTMASTPTCVYSSCAYRHMLGMPMPEPMTLTRLPLYVPV